MFDEIFFPRTAEKHRAAPLAEPRARYLRHLREIGTCRSALRKCANDHLNLVRLLNLQEDDRISIHGIETAATIWSRPKGRRCDEAATAQARKRFISHGIDLLRFLGWLDEVEIELRPHHAEMTAYEHWLRRERGLSEATIESYCRAADHFFSWLAGTDVPLINIGIVDIDDVIAAEHRRGAWNRRTTHDYAQRLKAFFLFAEAHGWCRSGLAAGIVAPRFMADETVPKGVRREDVLRLLASVQGDRPVEKRDRAILMLFVAYGLRAGEVAGLRLDDLDWENEIIRVRCPKPGRTHVWPLSPAVGHAILRYIADGRPDRSRTKPLLHVASAYPTGRPKDSRQNRPRSSRRHRHRQRSSRNACFAACCCPASSGPGHVYESDRGLSRTQRPVFHRDLRQGESRGPPRGGGP